MVDVFISYKSEDRAEAQYIKIFLQASGLKCWMDQQKILVGQDYEKKIGEIMPQCRSIVLLLSNASQKSKEVKKEYELARRHGLLVFPVRIEDCKLSDYYDEELRHTQVENEYWESEIKKQIALGNIRDQIYDEKGEEIKTASDLLQIRTEYYQIGRAHV